MADSACTPGVHLPEEQLELVRGILRQNIPGKRVWAFGSKRFSDLDLAVEGELTWAQRAQLAEAFEESLLPIKVDVAELDLLTREFRERIERDFVAVQMAESERT